MIIPNSNPLPRILFLLFGLGTIAIIITLYFADSQYQEADSTNKQTFTNQEYNFSLTPPGNWETVIAKPRVGTGPVDAHAVLKDDELYKVSFLEHEHIGVASPVTLRVTDNQGFKSIAELRDADRQQRFDQSRDCVEPVPFGCMTEEDLVERGEETLLGGEPAYTDIQFSFDSREACTEAIKGQYKYQFCYTHSTPNHSNFTVYKSGVEQILQSFMFI